MLVTREMEGVAVHSSSEPFEASNEICGCEIQTFFIEQESVRDSSRQS